MARKRYPGQEHLVLVDIVVDVDVDVDRQASMSYRGKVTHRLNQATARVYSYTSIHMVPRSSITRAIAETTQRAQLLSTQTS